MTNTQLKLETCECIDCIDSESPCYGDCDSDNYCQGCLESTENAADREFDEMKALGYKGVV